MKRDWELVRTICLTLEERGSTTIPLRANQVSGYDEEVVSYHMQLLHEAGLIHAKCSHPLNAPLTCWALSLTWRGHEFLDQIRQETVWNRVVALAREKGLSLSFDVIVAFAKQVIGGIIG